MSSRLLNHLHFAVPIAVTLGLALAGMARAAGPFDGTYRGSQTVLRNSNYQGCIDRTDIVLIIRNNHFTRQWVGNVIDVDVAGDGTFTKTASFEAGRNRQATLTVTGKIASASLEADIGSDRCRMHLSLRKS